MSQSKKRRIKILNPAPGQQPHTSLEHARRYVRKGAAVWHDTAYTILRMVERTPELVLAPWQSTNYRPKDSGFDGFLRYPVPCGLTQGPKYPALARMGAGMA